jgi:hypothetical protein
MTTNNPLYRVYIMDRTAIDAPVAHRVFMRVPGKYADAWKIARAIVNGEESKVAFYADDKCATPQKIAAGKRVTIANIDEVRAANVKIDANAIAAIMANAKLDDAAKVAAINALQNA